MLTIRIIRVSKNLYFHVVDVFLCFLDHLKGFVPLLLECKLGPLDFSFFNLHPFFNLSWLILVSFGVDLFLCKFFFQMWTLSLFTEGQALFAENYQFFEFIILKDSVEFFLWKLLECFPVKDRVWRLADSIVVRMWRAYCRLTSGEYDRVSCWCGCLYWIDSPVCRSIAGSTWAKIVFEILHIKTIFFLASRVSVYKLYIL